MVKRNDHVPLATPHVIQKAVEKLSLSNASGRKSLFLAFWPRQKAKLGLGEGF